MAQLRHRLGLNLANTLAGNPVNLADFIESLGLSIG